MDAPLSRRSSQPISEPSPINLDNWEGFPLRDGDRVTPPIEVKSSQEGVVHCEETLE